MRLGTWPTKIIKGTLAEKIYGDTEVTERHRHRYEFNMKYRDQMNAKGFVISGTSPDGTLAELIELRDHPVFCWLPVSPRIPKQAKQTAPALQRIYSSMSGTTDWSCDARSSRSRIAAPSPRQGTRSATIRSRADRSSSRKWRKRFAAASRRSCLSLKRFELRRIFSPVPPDSTLASRRAGFLAAKMIRHCQLDATAFSASNARVIVPVQRSSDLA